MSELVRVHMILLAKTDERMGQLNVAANRSLQDAPEDGKPSVDDLVELLIDTVSRYFQLCDVIDGVRVIPPALLQPHPAIAEWKEAKEKLKRETSTMKQPPDECCAIRRYSCLYIPGLYDWMYARPAEAAGAVDANNAPTTPWKTHWTDARFPQASARHSSRIPRRTRRNTPDDHARVPRHNLVA